MLNLTQEPSSPMHSLLDVKIPTSPSFQSSLILMEEWMKPWQPGPWPMPKPRVDQGLVDVSTMGLVNVVVQYTAGRGTRMLMLAWPMVLMSRNLLARLKRQLVLA